MDQATLLVTCPDRPGLVAAPRSCSMGTARTSWTPISTRDPEAGSSSSASASTCGELHTDRRSLTAAIGELAQRIADDAGGSPGAGQRKRVGDLRLAPRPLPLRPAAAPARGRARLRDPADRQQPPRPRPRRRASSASPTSVFPITPETKREQEQRELELLDGRAHRSGRARALHAGALGAVRRALDSGRVINIHHSLPAGVQRRPALPAGVRARREADRRDGPLRDRRISTRGRSSSRT